MDTFYFDLPELGYVTGSIKLSYTGIELELDKFWYRDDGFVDSLFMHSRKFWSEIAPQDLIPHAEINDNYADEEHFIPTTNTAHIIGAILYCNQSSLDQMITIQIACKAIKILPGLPKHERETIYLFQHGHEEAELIYWATGSLELIREWLTIRGYNSLSSRFNYINNILDLGKEGAKEMEMNMVGAVLVKCAGLPLEHFMKYSNDNVREAYTKMLGV